jgi:riboflavin transporter FmnP
MNIVSIATDQFDTFNKIEDHIKTAADNITHLLDTTQTIAEKVNRDIPFIADIIAQQDTKIKNIENHILHLVIILSVLGGLLITIAFIYVYRDIKPWIKALTM